MTPIGDRLKMLRQRAGLSQTQLADRLHVSQSAIANWEINLRQPQLDTGRMLADFFHVPLLYMLGETDDENAYATTVDRLMELRALYGTDAIADALDVEPEDVTRMMDAGDELTLEQLDALRRRFGYTLDSLRGLTPELVLERDEEMWQLREEFRRTPELRTLFDAARNARPEDLRRAISIIEALKKESGNV